VALRSSVLKRAAIGAAALLVLLIFWRFAGRTGHSEYGPPRLLCSIENKAINESSGIAASRRNPGIFWTHNDSGDAPRLFAIDTSCKVRAVLDVAGATAFDWEDIAVGPGPDRSKSYIYIADTGNNRLAPRLPVVFRVEEPLVDRNGETIALLTGAHAAELRFSYPDQAHDTETLLVHPHSGDVYLVTKAWPSDSKTQVFKAPYPQSEKAVTKLTHMADLTFEDDTDLTLLIGRITGGDISPDGRRVALTNYLRGYEAVLPRLSSGGFDAIWKQPFYPVDLGARAQGESLAYRLDGRALLFTSEGFPCPLWQVDR
jgi:hypothetical protein